MVGPARLIALALLAAGCAESLPSVRSTGELASQQTEPAAAGLRAGRGARAPAPRAPAATAHEALEAEAGSPSSEPPLWVTGLDPSSAEGIALDLLGKLRNGDVLAASSRFDDEMWSSLRDEGLIHVWPLLVEQGGPFRGVGSVRRVPHGWHDAVHVVCRFARGDVDATVLVTKDGRIHGLSFAAPGPPPYEPPEYVDASSVIARDVEVGELSLPGELTLPRDGRSLPAVVLVHGSGPQDRDARAGMLRPFRDLALGLTSRGIAVLRFDKRTQRDPATGNRRVTEELTLESESMRDARSALGLLRHEPRVDPARIFLVGHSLGGVAALRVARADGRVAGVVLLAAPARRLEDVILEQVRYLARLESGEDAATPDWLAELEGKVERARSLRPGQTAPASELPFSIPAGYWLDLAAHPPTAVARQLGRPLLVLHGLRDYQVTQADVEAWQTALEGVADTRIERFADLNHAFVAGRGPPSPADYGRPGHVAVEVVERIADFVHAHSVSAQATSSLARSARP